MCESEDVLVGQSEWWECESETKQKLCIKEVNEGDWTVTYWMILANGTIESEQVEIPVTV